MGTMGRLLLLMVMVTATCITPGSSQSLSVSFKAPRRIAMGHLLALDCRPRVRDNDFGSISAYVFSIQTVNDERARPLLGITLNRNGGQLLTWGNQSLRLRSEVESHLGLANVSFAQIRISEANCVDSAEYTCVMEFDKTTLGTSRKVTVFRNPSGVFPITATSVQREEMTNDNLGIISTALRNAGSSHNSVLRIGSVAIFNCTAKESLPPPTIRWCMRGPSEDTFRNFAFASVQRLEMVNSSIPEESCFFATTSLLPFVITSADNGTQLTCSTDTADCESSPRSNMESIFTIIVSDADESVGEPSNEDDIEVIQTDSQSSAAEYETLKERERYQTLSDVSAGSAPVSYEVLDRQPSYEYTQNYVNSEYRVYSDVGEPRT
uniref:Uncharacterized protein n=1 Tax=Magallana gigas TaxID=29159 RepID=K1RKF5_MAGGI